MSMDYKGVKRPTVVSGESKTQQHFKDQVNINTIIDRHRRTGQVSHLNTRTPFYGDVSDLVDYQTSLNVVKKAEDMFMSMPSRIRERFANDPNLMIKFLSDPRNREEAEKLGLVDKKPDPLATARSLKDLESSESPTIDSKASKSSKGHKKSDED